MNEPAADEHDPDRYAARFAHQVWLGLTQVAADTGAAAVSFTFDRDPNGDVHAAASLRTGERDVRYAVTLEPGPDGPPVEIAAPLFVTAVEERLRSPGFKNPAAQLAIAAAQVDQRRTALGDHDGPDPILAGALASHATLLARQGHSERAIAPLDEAIRHYTALADTDPAQFQSDLERAVALREQCQPA